MVNNMSAKDVNDMIEPLHTVASTTGMVSVTEDQLRDIAKLIPLTSDSDRGDVETQGSLIGNWPQLVIQIEDALNLVQEAALAGEPAEEVSKLYATELGVAIYSYITSAIVMTVTNTPGAPMVAGPYPVTGQSVGDGLGKLT